MQTSRLLKFALVAVLLGSRVWSVAPAGATLTLSDYPLFLTGSVEPNIVLTLDDSGSMAWAYVPDALLADAATKRFKSTYYNAMYYDPTIVYTPPPMYNGGGCTIDPATNPATCYANATFTAAPINGYDATRGTVNLSSNYKAVREYNPSSTSQTFADSTATSAYYYLFWTQAGVTLPTNCTATVADQKIDDDCYVLRTVGATNDIAPGTATQKKQNFANWYSYYRTRNLATVSGTLRAFAGLGNNVRVAWQDLHTCTSLSTASPFSATCSGWTSTDYDNRIKTFSGSHKTDFFSWAARLPASGGTPMRSTMQRAGEYYKATGVNSSYAEDPTVTDGTNYTCRQNYHIMFTDGLWNGDDNVNFGGNVDSTAKTLPDGTAYTPIYPYKNTTTLPSTNYNFTCGVFFDDRGNPGPDRINIVSGTGCSFASLSGTSGVEVTVSGAGSYNGTYTATYSSNTRITVGNAWGSDSANPVNGVTLSWSIPTSAYSYSNTLSDIAFKYWSTDLNTTLANNVHPHIAETSTTPATQYWNAKNDPATWQHMVNFTIGLGLGSTLVDPAWGGSTYAGDYSALAAGTKFWPFTDESPVGTNPPYGYSYVADLWHAAINSRGQFFSAENPQNVVDAFSSIVSTITTTNASSAALAANSTSLNTGTVVYQAQFDSTNWSGHFYDFTVVSSGVNAGKVVDINNDGRLDGVDANWDAATLIPAPASRNIFPMNGGRAQAFSTCTSGLATALNKDSFGVVDGRCADRLAWLRGDTTQEERFPPGIFRNRPACPSPATCTNVLGDIVNSDPIFSYNEDYGYTSLPSVTAGQSTYASYVASKSARPPMVYVGANDGMLHGFRSDIGNADSGKELLAYVPGGVYDKLSALTDPAYTHKYLVDGPANASDAYLGGSWKTVLVGSLGAGGKSVYALDVSSPGTFDATKVLWEFSDATDLGLTYGQPQIGRLHDGSWAAIFGNGYNSTADRAYLYIVNLETGALISKIPTDSTTANGLSTPALYDSNNDKIIDAVYAGDLQGRLWKFDLSSSTPASWTATALFTATNTSGQAQPITSQPLLGASPVPASGGVMVYFGTGSFITTTDIVNTDVQSYYAIWDTGTAVTRSMLQQQTVLTQTDDVTPPTPVPAGPYWRTTSANAVDYAGTQRGWYMDLLPPSGTHRGERVIYRSQVLNGRVLFVTLIPSTDKCVPGGTGWLMELSLTGGAMATDSIFDTNGDGTVDSSDASASGVTPGGGIPTVPVVIIGPAGIPIFKLTSASSAAIGTTLNANPTPPPVTLPTRIFWRQIQ
ncbi:MAG: PilC/PilY family type IV pilus protein [Sulfuricella sp.]